MWQKSRVRVLSAFPISLTFLGLLSRQEREKRNRGLAGQKTTLASRICFFLLLSHAFPFCPLTGRFWRPFLLFYFNPSSFPAFFRVRFSSSCAMQQKDREELEQWRIGKVGNPSRADFCDSVWKGKQIVGWNKGLFVVRCSPYLFGVTRSKTYGMICWPEIA